MTFDELQVGDVVQHNDFPDRFFRVTELQQTHPRTILIDSTYLAEGEHDWTLTLRATYFGPAAGRYSVPTFVLRIVV